MRLTICLAIALISLTGCNFDDARSADYYYQHPQEAQQAAEQCRYHEQESQTCKNVGEAMTRITGEALTAAPEAVIAQ